jgi:hypothetical protein
MDGYEQSDAESKLDARTTHPCWQGLDDSSVALPKRSRRFRRGLVFRRPARRIVPSRWLRWRQGREDKLLFAVVVDNSLGYFIRQLLLLLLLLWWCSRCSSFQRGIF